MKFLNIVAGLVLFAQASQACPGGTVKTLVDKSGKAIVEIGMSDNTVTRLDSKVDILSVNFVSSDGINTPVCDEESICLNGSDSLQLPVNLTADAFGQLQLELMIDGRTQTFVVSGFMVRRGGCGQEIRGN